MEERSTEFRGLLRLYGATDLPEEEDPGPGGMDGFSSHAHRMVPEPSSEFAAAVAHVTSAFNGTARLVQRLQKLVTRKGMHNDPTAEIDDVTAAFRRDLEVLQRQIESLSRHAEATHPRGGQRQKHFMNVVEGLKARTGEHTRMVQEALQVRTNVLREQSERRKQFTHSTRTTGHARFDSPLFMPPPPPTTQTQSAPNSGSGSSTGLRYPAGVATPPHTHTHTPPHSQTHAHTHKTGSSPPVSGAGVPVMVPGLPPPPTGGPYTRTPPSSSNGYPPPPPPPPPPVAGAGGGGGGGLRRRYAGGPGGQSVMMQINDHSAGQRLEDARQIEKAISELGQTFSKMAGLVAQQAEVVVRIEDDVDMALDHVTKGHQSILEFYDIVKGNRSAIFKVFAIMIVFIIVFVKYF